MQNEKLLPDRYSEGDFFVPDIFDNLAFKDDMASMEHPIFSLSTKPEVRDLHYKNGAVEISIQPTLNGLPTIFDKDILLYCGSLIIDKINKGEQPSRTLRISIRDLIVATNRIDNGLGYERIKAAFKRLEGVSINTNIKVNKRYISEGFGLIDSWRIIESSKVKNRMVRIEVTLSQWYYNALLGNEVLTIDRQYFQLRKPLERRLYEIARKHCGKQARWKISLPALQKKTGSKSPEKKFRLFIRDIIKHNHLPQYEIYLDGDDNVHFVQKIDPEQQPVFDEMEDTLHQIRLDTLHKCREIARQSRLDYYEIEKQFKRYINTNGIPECPNGAMVGFFKKKAGMQ